MKYAAVSLTTMILIILTFAATVSADVPNSMNYQGRLTDNLGNPVPDAAYAVVFRIYDGTGAIQWEESHTVTTTDGYFSVQLGSNGSPLTGDVFDVAECWLGITVGNDSELAPRTLLSTVPYAFKTGEVQSNDIIDEPGVAAFSGAYYIYLDDSVLTNICSQSITCPDAGYVMAVAHGRIATLPQHTNGTNSYATVGISDVPGSLPGKQDLDVHIDGAAPTGTYSIPWGMTSMFTVPEAGTYTYYMLGFEYSGSVSVADMQFNLVYFPTAYGSVDAVPPPVKMPTGDGPGWFDGEAVPEPWGEQGGVEPLDVTRIEAELSEMRARIDSLQEQIRRR